MYVLHWYMAHLTMRTSKKKETNNITIPVTANFTHWHAYAGTEGRGIAPTHSQPGTSTTLQALYTLGRELVSLAQEAEWALGLFWMVRKFSPPTGIWSPDHQVSNKSQYWLHHPGCHHNTGSFSVTMGTPKEEIIWVGFHLEFMASELTHLMLDVVFRNKHCADRASQAMGPFLPNHAEENSELPLCSTDSWVFCCHSWTVQFLNLPLKWNGALSLLHCKQMVQKCSPL